MRKVIKETMGLEETFIRLLFKVLNKRRNNLFCFGYKYTASEANLSCYKTILSSPQMFHLSFLLDVETYFLP